LIFRSTPLLLDWNGVGFWIAERSGALAGTIGVTGVGIGFVKFLSHAPAPHEDSVWAGCLFDTFRDLASNESRIGERRGTDSDKVAVTQQSAPEIPLVI
jgi:hypothetical protein